MRKPTPTLLISLSSPAMEGHVGFGRGFVAPNRTAIPNGNDTLLGRLGFLFGRVGGRGLDNTLNTASDAAIEAQKGAIGFANSMTFGLSGTGGVNPNDSAFRTGGTVGTGTQMAMGAVAVGGLAAAGTPTFFSGMSAASAETLATANGGYTVGMTMTGSFVANTVEPLVLNTLGANVGGTVMTGVWGATSAAYSVVSAATSPTVLYFGSGAGRIWTNVEQPILNAMGAGIVKP